MAKKAKENPSLDIELVGGGYWPFIDKPAKDGNPEIKGNNVFVGRPVEIKTKEENGITKNASILMVDEDNEEWYLSPYQAIVDKLETVFDHADYPEQSGDTILDLKPLMRIESATDYHEFTSKDGEKRKALDFPSIKIISW